MANRIEPFTVTVPAGTPIAAYQKTNLSMQDGRIDRIQIRIPPGPSGLVGFRLAHSGQSVIPYTGERWFVTDSDKLDWDTEGYPENDAWQLWAYNTDIYDHVIYVWMHVTDRAANPVITIQPLAITPVSPAEIEPATEGVA